MFPKETAALSDVINDINISHLLLFFTPPGENQENKEDSSDAELQRGHPGLTFVVVTSGLGFFLVSFLILRKKGFFKQSSEQPPVDVTVTHQLV